MTTRSDEDLMIAYRNGDTGALRELFGRYARSLARAVQRMLRDEERTQDIVQQTFLQMHRARSDFDDSRRFRPWLYTIALNLARDELRRQKRRPESSLEREPQSEGESPERRVERQEASRRVRRAMVALSREQRQVVELHWFQGLTFPEIAEATGHGLSAVKVRAHRAYKRMRESLER